MRIHLIFAILFFCLLSSSIPAYSATTSSPVNTIDPMENIYKKIASIKIRDFQKLAGRKLTLKEKISFLILKHKLKHKAKNSERQGQTSFTLGLAALGAFILGLFVPFVLLGSLVLAILAIVTGSMAKKKNPDDRKASGGKLLGWITLGLIALVSILAVIVLASWI